MSNNIVIKDIKIIIRNITRFKYGEIKSAEHTFLKRFPFLQRNEI